MSRRRERQAALREWEYQRELQALVDAEGGQDRVATADGQTFADIHKQDAIWGARYSRMGPPRRMGRPPR